MTAYLGSSLDKGEEWLVMVLGGCCCCWPSLGLTVLSVTEIAKQSEYRCAALFCCCAYVDSLLMLILRFCTSLWTCL
jgi:hypothetical protein